MLVARLLLSSNFFYGSKIRALDAWTIIIITTLFGFLALAAMLLVPVYRFLRREERTSREWTPSEMAKREKGPSRSSEDELPSNEESAGLQRRAD